MAPGLSAICTPPTLRGRLRTTQGARSTICYSSRPDVPCARSLPKNKASKQQPPWCCIRGTRSSMRCTRACACLVPGGGPSLDEEEADRHRVRRRRRLASEARAWLVGRVRQAGRLDGLKARCPSPKLDGGAVQSLNTRRRCTPRMCRGMVRRRRADVRRRSLCRWRRC